MGADQTRAVGEQNLSSVSLGRGLIWFGLVGTKTWSLGVSVLVFVLAVSVFAVSVFVRLRSRDTLCGVVCAAQSEERWVLLTNKEQLIPSCRKLSTGEPPNTNAHTNANTHTNTITNTETNINRGWACWLPPSVADSQL